MTSPRKTVGVIVGRFQVAEPHPGHKHLVARAMSECDSVAIVLGTGRALPSKRNPLPFAIRAAAARESFPDAVILTHPDHPSDKAWSAGLDDLLAKQFPSAAIRLYASRDGFASHYFGGLPIELVPELPGYSGTNERACGCVPIEKTKAYRQGMIDAQKLRRPLSYQTVDIAVVRHQEREILLGQKETDDGTWRLIGGFVDPTDGSLETAALRELREEAGQIDTHELTYLGSHRVDDWGYRGEDDKILTALFLTYYLGGAPRAADDLARVAWYPLSIDPEKIVPEHRPLLARVVEALKRNGTLSSTTQADVFASQQALARAYQTQQPTEKEVS